MFQMSVPHRLVSREEKPPEFSRLGAGKAKKTRWVPPSASKRDIKPQELKVLDDKNDHIFRKVRGILNKLTPEKFDKLSLELLNVGIESQIILKGIILLIFEKALDEPKYSTLYAQLCHRLCDDAPNFEPSTSSISTFRRLLLNKCQDEFENRSKATEVFDKKVGPLTDDEMEYLRIAKHKMLGNIKFIGELGKLEMLHEGILHKCIKQLLEKKKNIQIRDLAEDLECLCQIIRTVGRRLDTPKAKTWMDQYFLRVKSYHAERALPSRIRFMLQDVMELRLNKWVPRHVAMDHGPKTIGQIRRDAADEMGVYIPQNSNMTGGLNMYGGVPTVPMMNGGMGSGIRGGIGDIFSSPPMGFMASIGTGPGVIHDSYGSGYTTNNNRQRSNQQNQNYSNNYVNKKQDGGGGGGGAGGSPRVNRQNQQGQQKQTKTETGSRDLPPRFQRMNMNSDQSSSLTNGSSSPTNQSSPRKEEISLRPAKNYNQAILRPNAPSMLPKSAQMSQGNQSGMSLSNRNAPHYMGTSTSLNPLLNKQPQITIKQVKEEKVKVSKREKTPPKKDEVMETSATILEEYLDVKKLDGAISKLKDLTLPKRYVAEVLHNFMKESIYKSDDDREAVVELMTRMKTNNLFTSEHFMEALESVIECLSELETDVPLVKSYVAKLGALAVSKEIISLSDLSGPMENGAYYPLFVLCLQQLHKARDKDWLRNVFNESKVNLESMLPETDRNKERMTEILEDRGLSFLFPLLRMQTDIWRQIVAEPSPNSLFKWIKENVDSELQSSPKFINIIISNLIKYITQGTSIGKDLDPTLAPDKQALEREKELVEKFKTIFQVFLKDNITLQLSAIYAIQVFCHEHQFPKGMLLRIFMHMYDFEIIDEEAFLKWKEEVNNEYPGKGKALFQVNQWLTWLEQAEEETDEED